MKGNEMKPKKKIYCSICGIELKNNSFWMCCSNDDIYRYKDGTIRCWSCKIDYMREVARFPR